MAKAFSIVTQFEGESRAINKALIGIVKQHYIHVLRGLENIIRIKLQDLIAEAVENCELYDSLVNQNEEIYFELGAIRSPQAMRDLVSILRETVIVTKPTVRISNNTILVEMICSAVNTNWSKITNLPSATYTSYGKNNTTTEINWLKWLLTSPPFIEGYQVEFGSRMQGSRTGGALMRKIDGGSWELPIEFQGVPSDNFVTRAISKYNVNIKLEQYIYNTINRLIS